jgi:hypothetical protein
MTKIPLTKLPLICDEARAAERIALELEMEELSGRLLDLFLRLQGGLDRNDPSKWVMWIYYCTECGKPGHITETAAGEFTNPLRLAAHCWDLYHGDRLCIGCENDKMRKRFETATVYYEGGEDAAR